MTLKMFNKKRAMKLHVFSCYVPTFTANREEEDGFFATLQEKCYRVGSRQANDEWWYERGPRPMHGYVWKMNGFK